MALWPFRRPTQTPASYEKHLLKLSTRIHRSASSLAARRAQARRFRALWTLYSSVAYLVYLIVALLVVGWREWGPYEISAAAGGPVAIYGVRKLVDTLMGWRVLREEEKLQGLKRERESVIRELKEATGYDRTRGLLDKYGGEKKRSGGGGGGASGGGGGGGEEQEGDDDEDGSGEGKARPRSKRNAQRQQHQQPQRTGFAPPPTANIPGRQSLPPGFRPNASSPPPPRGSPNASSSSSPPLYGHDGLEPSASFAPNAFPGGSGGAGDSAVFSGSPTHMHSPGGDGPFASPPASPWSVPEPGAPRWYDRLLDVLLGDDESAPRNRLALLCSTCGLVNGLAPPGARTLAEVGRWRCSGCGAVNNNNSSSSSSNNNAASAAARVDEGGVDGATGTKKSTRSGSRARGEDDEASGAENNGAEEAADESDRTIYSDEEEAEADAGADADADAEKVETEAKGPAKKLSAAAKVDESRSDREDTPARGTRSRRKKL